jgi:hypothetical protein
MNGQTLEKIIALGEPYGPWGLAGVAIFVIAHLLIRRGFSLSVRLDVGHRR